MARRVAQGVKGIVLGVVITSLSYGAFVATADARSRSTCPFEPPSHLGACTTQDACDQACDAINGNPDNFGFCGAPGEGFCCHCILA